MLFNVGEVEVYFPYEYVYPEQYKYMCELKKVLDTTGHCILEMPSGTGKTITLLAFILSYTRVHKRKLIYCTRTVHEIDKVVDELKRLVEKREEIYGSEKIVGVALASRKNLCINEEVSSYKTKEAVDAKCQNKTASFVRARASIGEQVALCDYFERLAEIQTLEVPPGIYGLEELRSYGAKNGLCPYYLCRRLLAVADVIVYSYHYLLDRRIRDLVSKQLSSDSIVVFDEAHNIDNVCIESLSITLKREDLTASSRCITRLKTTVKQLQNDAAVRVEGAFNGLRQKDTEIDIVQAQSTNDALPGNVRKSTHFLSVLSRWNEFLKTRLKLSHVLVQQPLAFVESVEKVIFVDRKTLRFMADRLSVLVQVLEMQDLDELKTLANVVEFAQLVSNFRKGFVVLYEPYDLMAPNVPFPVIRLVCTDASIAIKAVFDRFKNVVITSGTLSPIGMYPRLLGFTPAVSSSFEISLVKNSINPIIVARGSDQTQINTKFETRHEPSVVRNYNNVLLEFSKFVPDGLVCFFPSYVYMESVVTVWNEMNLIQEVIRHKLLFIETPDFEETSIALSNYKHACDSGRGAIFLCVTRGKVSEGVDFNGHYGRCVLVFGIPYRNTQSLVLRERLRYLSDEVGVKEQDFLAFDAIRHASQCVGRVLRGKDDYGLVVYVDSRYAKKNKRSKFPMWLDRLVEDSSVGVSTDMAISIAKNFFRVMAQGIPFEDQKGVTLWNEEDIREYNEKNCSL